MEKFNFIKLYQLVIVYLILIGAYIVLPHSDLMARQILSVTALFMLGLIFLKSIQVLRQS